MSVAPWRAALRLAARDDRRARGRTALVVALIGLPVLVLGVVAIGYRTYSLSPGEKLARSIGTADLAVRWSGLTTVSQNYEGWLGDATVSEGEPTHLPSTAQITALMPPGSRVVAKVVTDRPLTVATRSGLALEQFVGLDVGDPLARGIVSITAGRAPRTTGEVAVTPATARADGLHVGDLLRAEDPSRAFRIVGVVASDTDADVRAVYGLPAAVPPLRDPFADASADWLVDTPGPVPWATVLALNAHGLEAISRAVYLHPTRASRRVPVQLGTPADSNNLVVALTLVGGMALLEVVLLAGPAFAVGAKRRRRELAVLGAVGGSPADLRRSVLAGGVVLGTLAGLAGTIGAIAVAAAGEPLMEHLISRRPGAFTVPVAQLVALFGVAVLAAVAAAALPARAAARTDLVASLGGRRGTTRTRRRLTALGLAVAAAGAAVSLTATVSSSSALVILGGAALLEVGLIMCTPALLGFVARGGRRLPLQARLALRDTGRNRSAATPAVAAVMAAAIGAVSIAIALASVDDQDRRQYVPALPPNTARVTLPAGTSDATSASVARALARTLPSAAVAVLHAPRTACPGPADSCTVTTLVHLDDAQRTGLLADILVAGPDDAAALFGPGSTAERDALRHGMALVSDPTLARGGQVPLALTPMTVTADGLGTDGSGTGQQVAFTLPAQAMHGDAAPATIVVPAAALSGRGADLAPVAVLVRTRQLPTDAQLQAATARVRRVVAGGVVEVERGYHNRYAAGTFAVVGGAVAIAVLAAVIATGLANVDAAPDLRTLGAVGATPRTRRTLASARAGVIAALGAVLGGGAGFVVPAAWELNQHRADPSSSLRFVVPWPTVLAVAVGIPVLAAAISGATTRSRLPIETSAA